MTIDKIPALSFVSHLSVNVDNAELTDRQFRDMVRNTLPIVDLFDHAKNCDELVDIQNRLRQAKRDFERAWEDIPVLTRTALATRESIKRGDLLNVDYSDD